MADEAGHAHLPTFALDGLRFVSDVGGRLKGADLPAGTYALRASERTIEYYRTLVRRQPSDILQLGMAEGGSLILWDRLFAPERLVGIDPRPHPIAAVEAYRVDRPHISVYHARGLDKPGTQMAARESFPTGIDLVIDDGSHRYAPTRQTFETLFPMLREGGTYVIEQWAWAHKPAAQRAANPAFDQPALTNLLFELAMLAATDPVIDSIHVEEGLVAIRKGGGGLPAGGITAGLALRGRELSPI